MRPLNACPVELFRAPLDFSQLVAGTYFAFSYG
jgi:hypothetical protein